MLIAQFERSFKIFEKIPKDLLFLIVPREQFNSPAKKRSRFKGKNGRLLPSSGIFLQVLFLTLHTFFKPLCDKVRAFSVRWRHVS